MFDIVISGGHVIDGSGSPQQRLDVAINNDKIAKIAPEIKEKAKSHIDASGKIIAPGFIDAHTHDDRLLLSDPLMTPKVSQGVTTVVTGNCGVSLAPLLGVDPPPPMNLLGNQEWYRFNSVKEYRQELETAGAAINCAMLTGHSTLRAGAMDDLSQPASAKQIDQMCGRLDEALSEGCIGFSTGLAYPTASAAPTEEVIALANILGKHNAVYTTHMRDEGEFLVESVEETLRIGEQANVPVIISHHKATGKPNWGKTKRTIELINQARKKQVIHFDVYPYIASSTVLLLDFVDRADNVMITWSESHPEMTAKNLKDICSEWGMSVEDTCNKLQPAGAIYFQMDEKELQNLLQHTAAMIGSDGLPHDKFPHLRLWGTFTRVVGHYARELKLFSVEEAVHKMTGLTASVFGLQKRGLVAEDYYADLVIFDEQNILDKATFETPEEPSAGIEQVFVNGKTVFENGMAKSVRPGRWLNQAQ